VSEGAGSAPGASQTPRPGSDPLFHVVLHQPEIPNNTGNIGRTCVATACSLHLIHPLGFDTSEKACRRAGLDYWPRLDVRHHADWATFEGVESPRRLWMLHTSGRASVFDVELRRGDYLVFGRETRGLPADLLAAHAERVVYLPMVPAERSLNLATAVCAVVYEGLRQLIARHELATDGAGRLRIPERG
jgi:tRNA (cytidine/uridine-2'-O-)-methyltransferase